MGKLSREKGKRWEQKVARLIREAMPGAAVRRGLQSRDGTAVPDIDCPIFRPECKVGKKPPIIRALEQAEKHCPPGYWPVAVVKTDNEKPTITLRLEDFLELVKEWWAMRTSP